MADLFGGGFSVGGLVGSNNNVGCISNSYADGTVLGGRFVSGLTGADIRGGLSAIAIRRVW